METIRACLRAGIGEIGDFLRGPVRWQGLAWVAVVAVVSLAFGVARFFVAGPASPGFTVSGSYTALAHVWVGALVALAVPARWLPDRRWVFLAFALALTLTEVAAFVLL